MILYFLLSSFLWFAQWKQLVVDHVTSVTQRKTSYAMMMGFNLKRVSVLMLFSFSL